MLPEFICGQETVSRPLYELVIGQERQTFRIDWLSGEVARMGAERNPL